MMESFLRSVAAASVISFHVFFAFCVLVCVGRGRFFPFRGSYSSSSGGSGLWGFADRDDVIILARLRRRRYFFSHGYWNDE